MRDVVIDPFRTEAKNLGSPAIPCDPAGEPVEKFSVAAVKAAGTQVGDHWVVATDGELLGFQLPAG